METLRPDSTTPPLTPQADREARVRELFEGARAGDAAAVRAALDADPTLVQARDTGGDSVLIAAAYRGHRALAELAAERMRAEGGGGLDAWEAALLGDGDRLRALLDADPSLVRARRHDGWPLLHFAGFYGFPEIAALLLDRGADVGMLSDNHIANTALHATLAISGHAPTVELLVARGADANALGGGGYRPLHLAASRGSLPLVEFLLAHGADPAARSDDGQTAADIAAAQGHQAAAERLRTAG
jgi:ankyrin repeat protein